MNCWLLTSILRKNWWYSTFNKTSTWKLSLQMSPKCMFQSLKYFFGIVHPWVGDCSCMANIFSDVHFLETKESLKLLKCLGNWFFNSTIIAVFIWRWFLSPWFFSCFQCLLTEIFMSNQILSAFLLWKNLLLTKWEI